MYPCPEEENLPDVSGNERKKLNSAFWGVVLPNYVPGEIRRTENTVRRDLRKDGAL